MKKKNPIDRKKPVEKKFVKQDMSTKEIYSGEVPSIVGRQRILVRAKGKESFIYVNDDSDSVDAVKERYGNDFIRTLGKVTHDPRPVFNQKQ